MGKVNKRRFRAMQQKIAESKVIAERERKAMRYNCKPLNITCMVPGSDIRWGTRK